MLNRGVLMALVLAEILMYIYLALMTIGCSILYNIMTKKTTSYDWTLLPAILLVVATSTLIYIFLPDYEGKGLMKGTMYAANGLVAYLLMLRLLKGVNKKPKSKS